MRCYYFLLNDLTKTHPKTVSNCTLYFTIILNKCDIFLPRDLTSLKPGYVENKE
jgi:hypothetical protein